MAHHNNPPRTPRSPHNLQDERLFSLLGGIPPGYFNDLDFVSTRRGWRIAAPGPSRDPWGYYAEHGRSRHAGMVRSTQEVSAQPITTMTEGSGAVISDIQATRDPRELTLSETDERGPTPLEMRAGLPAGSYSPLDFEREFQTRHGVKPEDADKSWHSHYSSRGSSMVVGFSDREIRPPRTEAPSPTSPTRDMEIIRTPGVTRDQKCAEKSLHRKHHYS